ncbi:MAG: long-chain fatty acid--CoA ligase [Spirochaetes bacterium]|nr:MAG: long-chain fatty acid--CoA ligase [Spirochaetota bacterium]
MSNISCSTCKFLDSYRGKDFIGQWPTIDKLFRITVKRFAERSCFTSFDPEDFTVTYREALKLVDRIASYLQEKGVSKGDMVALTGKNTPEWAVSYLAILSAGGTVVPIDYQLEPERIAHLMEFAGVKALIVDEEKYDSILEKTQGLNLSTVLSLSREKSDYVFDINPEVEKPEEAGTDENDTAAILFTSGTTGNEKGVILTHGNFVSDVFLTQTLLGVSEKDIFYALLPLHHSYSMNAVFLQSISVGAEIVFAKGLVVKQILSDLKKGKVTMFLGIPLLFNKLLKAILKGIREKGTVIYGIVRFLMGVSGIIKKTVSINPGKFLFHSILKKASLDTVRICISGGGPLAPSTFRLFNQLGIDFVQGYGLTETAPIAALNPVEKYKETSVGKIIPHVDVKIVDKDANGVGEILIKGPIVTKGYYKSREETKEAFTEDGYFKTGDIGYLDSDNYLYLSGRKKSMIVTEGGKNVYPEEIEDHFQFFEEIEQIAVKGYIKDKEMKVEGIEALVYPSSEYFKENRDADAEKRIGEIIEEVNRELLPYQEIDKFTVLFEPMEMTTTKKIKRYKLKSN